MPIPHLETVTCEVFFGKGKEVTTVDAGAGM